MATNASTRSQALLFAQNFLKHPRMIGSLIPSSRRLIDRILSKVDWSRARVIVEYGPGVGTITREILGRMRPDAMLLAIEMNEDFAEYLKHNLRDPRLRVVRGSAADARELLLGFGFEAADYVISGIPYTTMPDHVREQILVATRNLLAPGGSFLVYQFTRSVLPHLESTFDRVHRDFEPLNILPAQLFDCRGDEPLLTVPDSQCD